MKRFLDMIAKRAVLFFVLFLIVLAAVPSLYFYTKYRSAQSRLQSTQAANQDAKTIVADITKLMVLPTDEEPTVATVTDKEKLIGQPFFANAQNGDKVVIYTKARKAILYRPTLNKIIDVGPVSITQQSATASATAATPVKVVLYNGTSVVGLTKRYETELKTKVPEATVADRDNAAKSDYLKTIIIDVMKDKPSEVQSLAQRLGVEVAPMPKGEATPAADFLIILGADKK